MLREGDWKLIERRAKDGTKHELYDLASDPYEKHDLAATQPDRVAALAAKLAEIRQADRTQLPEDLRRVPD